MKKTIWLLMLSLVFSGSFPLWAADTAEKTSALARVGNIEKRGWTNLATSSGEFVNVFKTEKKDHPKAWPATYLPHAFFNFATRTTSGICDIVALPWYAWMINDSTPITRHFDMPDYVWGKE